VSSADVGLSIIENICLSYYFCLPNKIFEYLSCGLPVIVSDFPEMAKIISDHKCGWKVTPEQSAIESLIDSIGWNEIDEMKKNSHVAGKSFDWRFEEPILIDMYRNLKGKISFA
jgi:glycosyltransferase involved in cell wall biosynthesis